MRQILAVIICITTFAASALAGQCQWNTNEKVCHKGGQEEGYGEQIATQMDPSRRRLWPYSNYCSSGKISITSSCGTDDIKGCRVAQLLVCRFCGEEGSAIDSYTHLEDGTLNEFRSKLSNGDTQIDLSRKSCQQLENTPLDLEKVVLSYEQFCEKRAVLLQRVARVEVELQKKQVFTPEDFKGTARLDWTAAVEDAITGAGGVIESIERMGSSKTMTRLKGNAQSIHTTWSQIKREVIAAHEGKDIDIHQIQFSPDKYGVDKEALQAIASSFQQGETAAERLSFLINLNRGVYNLYGHALDATLKYQPPGTRLDDARVCQQTYDQIQKLAVGMTSNGWSSNRDVQQLIEQLGLNEEDFRELEERWKEIINWDIQPLSDQ